MNFNTSSRRFSFPSAISAASDMPQPFNKIIADPYIVLDEKHWIDKPEVTGLVTVIFAISAKIETELGTMLARILGAQALPAIAMHEALNTQSLRRQVLEAAARAGLPETDFEYFLAVIGVLDATQKSRNRLAHWVWGYCKERPELVALADPKMVQETRQRTLAFFENYPDNKTTPWDEVYDLLQYDPSRIFAYSIADLKRVRRDLDESYGILQNFECYLDPNFSRSPVRVLVTESPEEVRAELLRQLNQSPLFREALARVQSAKDRKSNRPKKP